MEGETGRRGGTTATDFLVDFGARAMDANDCGIILATVMI